MDETTSSRRIRPSATSRPTCSVPAKGEMSARIRARTASRVTGAARRSGWDMAGSGLRQVEMGEDEIGDGGDIVDIDDGQVTVRQRLVAEHGHDLRIVGIEQRLSGLGAMDLEL